MKRMKQLVLLTALAAITGGAVANDLGGPNSQLQQAIDQAKQKQASGQKVYSVQSIATLDSEIDQFVSLANQLISCATQKSGFNSANSVQINFARGLIGNAQNLKSGGAFSALRPFLGNGVSSALQAAIPGARSLLTSCQNFSVQPVATNSKYDQMASLMNRLFPGNNLNASSPAVKHAVDVDAPVRGDMNAYLSSATVKNWYKTSYQLH